MANLCSYEYIAPDQCKIEIKEVEIIPSQGQDSLYHVKCKIEDIKEIKGLVALVPSQDSLYHVK